MEIVSKREQHVLTQGKIISVRGSVVDVRFESNLPSIYTVLHAGAKREIDHSAWSCKVHPPN